MLITASFGRILSDGHLNCFLPGRRLNVHPSLLPLYRGPAPIQRTLLDGRTETGVSVIEMMEKKRGIDAGEIWAQRRFVSAELQVCVRVRERLRRRLWTGHVAGRELCCASQLPGAAGRPAARLGPARHDPRHGASSALARAFRQAHLASHTKIQKPTPQAWDPSTPRAPLITADDALVDFATMTAEVIVRRHRAISHQVSR